MHTESIGAAFGNIKAILKMLSTPSFLGLRIVQSGPYVLPTSLRASTDSESTLPTQMPSVTLRDTSPVNLLRRPTSHPYFVL